jgi:transcriptional regulator
MYIPASFAMRDREQMVQFLQENSFGILFSQVQGRPFATHVPLLLDAEGNKLFGHLAKANPHCRELDGAEVLVVFQGPHAYISPSWYVERQGVPTWNYIAVHVYGNCHIVRDEKTLRVLLREMVRFYEPNSPLVDHLDEEYYVKMANAVVGLEIEITAMEGKAKLSQNKSPDTIRGVINGLRNTKDCLAGEVAARMEAYLDGRVKG